MKFKTVYLDKWDNDLQDSPNRIKGVNEVIEVVRQEGGCHVSFDYEGRTRHQSASENFAKMLPNDFVYIIGYNYEFIITLKK